MAEVGDITMMGRYAVELLSNETLLATMKQEAYEQACRFDIEQIVPRYEQLYSRFCRMDVCNNV